jgi:phosphomannomutase
MSINRPDVKVERRCCSTRSPNTAARPLIVKTGHSLIKVKMAETGSPLAGEMSGHVSLADRYYGYVRRAVPAVRLLKAWRGSRRPGGVARSAAASRQHPELRFPCADDRKFAVVSEVRSADEGGRDVRRRRRRAGQDQDAGGCCAPRTRKPCWWRAPKRATSRLERLKTHLVQALEQSGVALPDKSTAGH